ncbi:MAG: dihydroxyacetone kinase subunit DhaL [Cardiobacteriaceae bacterium]|nr:dihydroxyacetone kinase subunit DhaL [Cardiobacteriaceae bacterium]
MTTDTLRLWFKLCAQACQNQQDYLTDLDREIGDADHGLNMARGFAKVQEKLDASPDLSIADILKTAGMTLLSSVGGASGPLYGTFFIKAAQAVSHADGLGLTEIKALFEAGTQGIIGRGRAELGDKTMIDVWLPVCELLTNLPPETTLKSALQQASEKAEQCAQATIPMLAKKGRASYLNERSVGHQDAGATSSAIIIKALHEALS